MDKGQTVTVKVPAVDLIKRYAALDAETRDSVVEIIRNGVAIDDELDLLMDSGRAATLMQTLTNPMVETITMMDGSVVTAIDGQAMSCSACLATIDCRCTHMDAVDRMAKAEVI